MRVAILGVVLCPQSAVHAAGPLLLDSVELSRGDAPIPGLEVEAVLEGQEIWLKGAYSEPHTSLLLERQAISLDPKGGPFRVKVPNPGGAAESQLSLHVVSARGKITTEKLIFRFGLQEQPSSAAPWRVETSLLAGRESYRSPGANHFQQMGLVPKVCGTYTPRESRFSFSLGAQITAVGFGQSNSNLTSTRFLEADLGARYDLRWPQGKRWSLAVAARAFYRTMFSSPGGFGFESISGFAPYPEFRYRVAPGQVLEVFVALSPLLAGGLNFYTLDSRQFDAGIRWVKTGKGFFAAASYSQLSLETSAGTAKADSFLIGIGWAFLP